MRWLNVAFFGAALAVCISANAQSPTYGIGRAPTPEEIRSYDTSVGPAGKELPPGRGTAREGAAIFVQKCASCHGATATEGPADRLVGGQGSLASDRPLKTVGSYWPYATTVWDYVNRAMPLNNPGSLAPNEVYSVTAFILFRNGIVQETDVIDRDTLPKVRMPNRDGFVSDARPDWRDSR